ncbi:hypothetical protein U9M48_040339, partial [Paspalum notatum var. saurae]
IACEHVLFADDRLPMMTTTPLVVIGVTLILAWLLHHLLKRKSLLATLPPGSLGLPLLGETLQYGPIFKTNLLGKDLIVSFDTELNNYVIQQDEKAFQIWYPESFMRILGENNIVSASGSLHKYMRNMVLRLFGPENLRLLLLQDVHSAVNMSLASWAEKQSIELKTASANMILSVTAKWLIGYDASASSEELWQFYDIGGLLAFPLNVPGTAFHRCVQDFVDLLIDELRKEKPVLSEKVAFNLLFSLLFASFETTSSAITVILKFLTDNPKALQELTEEHEQILKRRTDPNSEITWEEYRSMKFTSCVIHESLRLANIAPVLFRKAKQDVQIKGYTIPEGWIVMICPAAVHLNPTTYKHPIVFNPWRWKDISEPVGGSNDFLAFGWASRFCVGADFAKLQMTIFLHYLTTKYRWKIVSGGNMVLSPGLAFPKGCHIQITT